MKSQSKFEIDLNLKVIREELNWNHLCRELEKVFHKMGVKCGVEAKITELLGQGNLKIIIDKNKEPKFKQD